MKKVINSTLSVLLVFCIVTTSQAAVGWETVGGIGLDAQNSPPPTPPGTYTWPHPIPYGIYTFPSDNGEKYARLVADNSLSEDSQYITQTISGTITSGNSAQQFLAHALPTDGATGVWVDLIYDGGAETDHYEASSTSSWNTSWWFVSPSFNTSSVTIRIGIKKDPAVTTGYRSVLIDRALLWCWGNPPLQWENYDFELQDRIYIEPSTLPTIQEENSTSTSYTIGLADLDSAYPPTANVYVTVDPDEQTRINSSAAGQAVQFTFTTSQPDQTHLVTVSAVDDMIMEGPHTSTITHTSSSADPDYDQFTMPELVVNIADNDVDEDLISVTLNDTTGVFDTKNFQIHMYRGEITYFYNKITETDYISGGIDAGSAVKSATLYADGTTAWGFLQDASWPAGNVFKYVDSTSSVSKTGEYEITWNFTLSGVTSSVRAWIDPNSLDLCVQQQSSGSRTDLHRLRWAMTNISPSLDVIIPYTGGMRLRDSDTDVIRKFFIWPTLWNVQFVVLQGDNEGFWVRSDDTNYITKGLEVDRNRSNNALGFDSEATPPFTSTSSMTSVNWRISSYQGNWTLPVHQYREWMAQNISIPSRPEWVKDVNLAVFNCPSGNYNGAIVCIDELATVIDPESVLLGCTSWRSANWATNQPDYTMSSTWNSEHDHWKITHGYKTMVWINPLQCNLYMPEYTTYSPWHVGNPLDSTDLWPTWFGDPPNTSYIHLGLDAWRNLLVTRLSDSFDGMNIRPNGVFFDESFAYGQSYHGNVDGKNQIEGNEQLHLDFLNNITTPGGLILAGEDLTEISFRGEAFAHIHGYGGTWVGGRWVVPQEIHDLLCPVFAVLFSPYTKLYGYWGLDGNDDYSVQCNNAYKILRLEPAVHELPKDSSGVYHILTENNHTEMNPTVEEIIGRANGSNRIPTLQSCSVTPADGTNVTGFDFQAIYTDLDNEGPGAGSDAYVHVIIDGIVYDMDLIGDPTYTTGASFSLHLDDFSLGSHSVHFECWDTWHVVRYPTSGELTFTVYRDSDVIDRGLTNLLDFAFFANQWMQPCSEPGWCVGTDFDHSQTVDFEDVLIFSSEYLK